MDFEDLAKKPELLTMELSNYFKYSDTYEADHNMIEEEIIPELIEKLIKR